MLEHVVRWMLANSVIVVVLFVASCVVLAPPLVKWAARRDGGW